MGPTDKLVLLYIAWRTRNPRHPYYLTADDIAEATGLSERTVRRALFSLEALGRIEADRTHGPGRRLGWTLPKVPHDAFRSSAAAYSGHSGTPDTVTPPTPDRESATPDTVTGKSGHSGTRIDTTCIDAPVIPHEAFQAMRDQLRAGKTKPRPNSYRQAQP